MTATKERPIIFQGPSVRAILDGRKTQARRIVRAPIEFLGGGGKAGPDWDDPEEWGWEDPENPSHFLVLARDADPRECHEPIACPYGEPGDRLWVRETHWCTLRSSQDPSGEYTSYWTSHVEYMEQRDKPGWQDGDQYKGWVAKRASIHMPRRASRITLEIVSIGVERLQDITEDDAIAEGVGPGFVPNGSGRSMFRRTWDEINGKRAPWESNPWVWAIEFRRLEANP